MSTETQSNVAVKTAFTLKSGKRGRPLKGEVGQLFNITNLIDGSVALSRPMRPDKTWTITAAQFAEWF